jgi:tetratricopeptide (TPR) repeat protein
MILDNADNRTLFYPQHQDPLNDKELQRYISTYLPECTDSDGTIIITTRDGRLGRELLHGEEPIYVEPLDKTNAEHLLRAKVRAEKWNPEAAETLLAILIYTPLAITQAAAYINCTHDVSVKTYLEMLQKDHSSMSDVLGEDFPDHRRQAGVANAIFKTLKLSYEYFRNSPDQRFKTAANILSLMAILDSQSIPATLLLEGIEITPNERAAIQVLRDFCLIRDRDDHCSLHLVVQLSIQDWLRSRGELLRYQEYGLLLLARRFPWYDDSVKDRTLCSKFLSQALHVLLYQSRNQVARADLLHNVGGFERERGQYDAALKHAEECRVIRRALLDHEKTLETEYLIGQLLEELGKYPEAETQHRYVLKHRVRIFGQDHQDTISSLGELAGVLGDQGKYKKAEAMQRCAVEGYVKNAPEDYAHISIGLNNLGHLLQEQQKFDEAEKVLRKALKIYEDTLGMESPEGLSTLDNMGVLLSDQGKGVEAEKMHRQGLEGREKVLGRDHPDTLTSITNLAVALDTQQRYIEAEELHREALTGKVAALREKHPDTLSTMNALAWNLHDQGKYEEAISLMRITKEGRVQVLGADHPHSKRSCRWHTEWLKEVQKRKKKYPNGKRGRNEKSLRQREETQVHKRSRHGNL